MKGWVPVSLKAEVVERLDELKEEMNAKSRSEVIERLIEFYRRHKEGSA